MKTRGNILKVEFQRYSIFHSLRKGKEKTLKKNDMKDLKFSLFHSDKGIKELNPRGEVDIIQLFKYYHSENLIELSKGVREAIGSSQDQLKMRLPYITPYGIFSQRENKSITHYNRNLIAIDLDHLELEEIATIRDICRNCENVLLCALSPRNKGLKILAMVNHEFTPENHTTSTKHHKKEILNILGLDHYIDKIDISQFTLSQGFFLCHDPHMIFNLNATAKNTPLQPHTPTRKEVVANHSIYNHDRISKYIQGVLNRNVSDLVNAQPGNRHATILLNIKGFGLIRNYAKELEEDYFNKLQNVIEFIYRNNDPEDIVSALRTLYNIQDKATPQSCDKIEEIINDNKEIQNALTCFLNGVEYESNHDEIRIFSSAINWYYDGYLLAQRTSEGTNICYRGYPTAKKIDRLKSIEGVDIVETSEGVLLYGYLWNGSTKTIQPKTLSHAE